ncbi:hypothetical protein [Haladaptatus caseinilyticus]|uniref:hypothetical protein n=1 Tax=Haladaptatus caseinilyticus TaxID=2993314 RepID=UPI00224B086A|nr:hypothetical protein [Haladaptatus caseinilyticus]
MVLLGDAVIPDGRGIQEWLDNSVDDTLEDVFRRSQALTGRYVIIHSDADTTTVIPDALAHKSVYYHTERDLLTSSLKLLFDSVDVDSTENSRVAAFMSTETFIHNESALIGDKTLFQNVRCVLPNHVLDVDTKRVTRRPLFPPEDHQSTAQYIGDLLSGAMEAFNDEYDLLTAITAGRDSRTILACSKDIVHDITWYTFSDWSTDEHPDVTIPKRIAAEHGFDYSVYHPRAVTDGFRTALEDYLCWTRDLPKTKNVQFLYNNYDPATNLYITGNGPIYKLNYTLPNDGADVIQHACDVLQYPDDDFIMSEIEEWLPGAIDYAEKYGIPPMILLYWELRMGRWGALAPREKDIAIRGISPFSNYNLLLAALNVDTVRLSPPDYDLINSIIRAKWPVLQKYPVNPSTNALKATVARAAPYPVERFLRYINAKIN